MSRPEFLLDYSRSVPKVLAEKVKRLIPDEDGFYKVEMIYTFFRQDELPSLGLGTPLYGRLLHLHSNQYGLPSDLRFREKFQEIGGEIRPGGSIHLHPNLREALLVGCRFNGPVVTLLSIPTYIMKAILDGRVGDIRDKIFDAFDTMPRILEWPLAQTWRPPSIYINRL